jgi:hypothetical protein
MANLPDDQKLHTPGPWTVNPVEERVFGLGGDVVVWELNSNEADGRLIAAAPELLALCKELENWLRPEVTKEPDRTYFWRLVEVIRKAEGHAAPIFEASSR